MDVLLFVVCLIATLNLVPLEALGNDCGPQSKLRKSYIDPSTNDQANIIEEMYGVTENDCYAACCDAVQTGNCNVVVFNRHSSSCVLMSCVPTDSCAVSDSNNHTVTFIGDPSVSTTTPASGSDSATTQASTSDTSTILSNSAVLSHEIQQPANDSVMETTTMSPLETALNAPDVEQFATGNSTTTAMIETSTQASKPLPKITEAFSFSESLSVSSNSSLGNIGSNLESTTSVKSASVEASDATNNYLLESVNKLNTTTNVDIVASTVATVTTASSSSSLSSTSQSASTGVIMSNSAYKSSSPSKLVMNEMSNSSTTLSSNTTQTLREEKQTTASTVEASPKLSSSTRSPLSSTLMSSARNTNQTRVSSTSASTTSDASSTFTSMKVVSETFSNASTEASTSNNTSTSSSSSSTKSSPSSIRSTTESPLHLPEIPTTTTSPNTTAQAQASGVGDNDEFQPLSAGLIAALSVGIIFFFAVMVLMGKRLFDSWHRRHYNRMDYLINGMYN